MNIKFQSLDSSAAPCICAAILRYEVAWFDRRENSSGAVAARLASDATLVKSAITERVSVLAQNLSLVAVALVIAFVLSWRMALVVLATYPVLVAAAWIQVKSHPHSRVPLP